jgi:hypothetical protein
LNPVESVLHRRERHGLTSRRPWGRDDHAVGIHTEYAILVTSERLQAPTLEREQPFSCARHAWTVSRSGGPPVADARWHSRAAGGSLSRGQGTTDGAARAGPGGYLRASRPNPDDGDRVGLGRRRSIPVGSLGGGRDRRCRGVYAPTRASCEQLRGCLARDRGGPVEAAPGRTPTLAAATGRRSRPDAAWLIRPPVRPGFSGRSSVPAAER